MIKTLPDTTTRLQKILAADGSHRLHPAMVLVGVHRLPAPDVLNLACPDLDLAQGRVRLPSGWQQVGIGTAMLLHWHGCRQRLDRLTVDFSWPAGLRVFVDGTATAATSPVPMRSWARCGVGGPAPVGLGRAAPPLPDRPMGANGGGQ